MGDRYEDLETFNCNETCFIGNDGVDKRRRVWKCTLFGYPRFRWDAKYGGPLVHMGSLPVYDPETAARLGNPLYPEELGDEGCPGGWYRCSFIASLLKYARLLTEGGFSSNILLDRCEDRLVIEAIQYLETEKLRSSNYCQKVRHDGYNKKR